MRIKRILLTIATISIATIGFSQSTLESKTEARNLSVENKVNKKERPITNSDGYMDQSRKILSKLNVQTIPSDFPKYKDGQTKEEYKKDIVIWMKDNKGLLTEETLKKLEEKHG